MNKMRPQIFQIPVYRIDLFCLENVKSGILKKKYFDMD